MFWFFDHEACGVLAPRPAIQRAPPALEGEVWSTGPPGKSRDILLKRCWVSFCQGEIHRWDSEMQQRKGPSHGQQSFL